jgi:glycosyltransferase involved in cell wall biosynthesis
MPVRNGAETLQRALSSLRLQTLAPSSVVVVDDGSTDSTPALLARWAADWPALKILRTSGLGIAGALNAGLADCPGEWIARMDADDEAHPERLARQLVAAREAGPDVALVGCVVRHAGSSEGEGMRRHVDWTNSQLTHEQLEQALWVDSPLPHPSWLVHRRALDAVGPYNETEALPEDYEWLHRFFARARDRADLRALKAPGEPLLDWFDAETRLTRTSAAYSARAFDTVKARALEDLLARRDPELFVFGLGPKSKALLPLLDRPVRAVVEVNPRQIGMRYRGIPVVGVEDWERLRLEAADSFVVIALGTSEARARGENLCREQGLRPLRDFVAL